MRSGNLRHVVKLQQNTQVQDSSGHPLTVWDGNNEIEVRGSIRALRGEELVEARRIDSVVSYGILIRNSAQVSSVDHSWRAVSGTKKYAIHAIMFHDPKQRFLMVLCSEGMQDQEATLYGTALYDADGNILQFVDGTQWQTVD